MRALICGAGIAGLTLTGLLDRIVWDVQLVERADSLLRGDLAFALYERLSLGVVTSGCYAIKVRAASAIPSGDMP
jgi:monoamine oxidase